MKTTERVINRTTVPPQPAPSLEAIAGLPPRPAPSPVPAAEQASEDEMCESPYGAFKPTRFVHGLELFWRDGRFKTIDYSQMIFTETDEKDPAWAILTFASVTVRLRGRNLIPLLQRIADRKQARVREILEDKDVDSKASAVYEILWERPER
jgi:hypothetical protein